MIYYTVEPGDSVYKISKKYQIPPEIIINDNALANPENLAIGQVLILNNNFTHQVEPGETPESIADTYDIPLSTLMCFNPHLRQEGMCTPGQTIFLPIPGYGTIVVNGYAYPSKSKQQLDEIRTSYPYLTCLSVFSHQIREDGSLDPILDEDLIQTALRQRVAPIMVITNTINSTWFDSELAHTILRDKNLQDTLLQNILAVMLEKGYTGLNVGFQYIFPDDKGFYNQFLKSAADLMHQNGFSISTALAPKASSFQHGLLFEAMDYPFHGLHMDSIILMTYEWDYVYGPPRAIAPIDKIKDVLNYAVTVIPRNKILLGIPNYGYDWTFPYQPGTTARVVTNPEAVELAVSMNAGIQYDTTAQSPYFQYYDPQQNEHIVWFEDPRSIYARLLLVSQYQLRGVSYWTVNQPFIQNWIALDSLFDVKKVT